MLKLNVEVSNTYQVVYLSATTTDAQYIISDANSLSIYKAKLKRQIIFYESEHVIKDLLQFTPIFINMSLRECPPGFQITYTHGSSRCECYKQIKNSVRNLKCVLKNHRGYMSWNTTAWIGFDEQNNLIYSKHCFPYYCRKVYKNIDVGNMTMLNSQQCWPNRQGVLCSQCTEGYSLAIGSSNCINCPNNSYLSLLIFFAISGFLLVLFILHLDLTVTQGMINGLIFYANIIWEHQSISSQRAIKYTDVFLKPFIAWLNLDFGIETCFVKGLTPYTKTWLQFLFPFYIWMIAGFMITLAHYSSTITNLMGNKGLHTLCTLFLLSYSKLFRIIKDILHITVLTTIYKNGAVYKHNIWLWEGERSLHDSKYLGLFLFATATLIFLWMPYTITLTCIQPLRRMSHYRCCKWVSKLSPVFDSYLAPLKHRHHYYFGVLLLVRGFLLLIVLVPSHELNLHNLMTIVILTLILIHMAIVQPYKSKVVLLFQCFSFVNLIILISIISYQKLEDQRYKYWVITTTVSVTLAFAQFCVLIVWSALKVYLKYCSCFYKACRRYQEGEEVFDGSIEDRRESYSADYLQAPTY